MQTFEGQRIVVVGGSRGLGLGVVEALVARKAEVTVVARDPEPLAEVKRRLGVSVIAGDATERDLARSVLREIRPSTLIVTAGANPAMGPIHQARWEDFEAIWNQDVRLSLFWTQEAIHLPMPKGGRVLLTSSGAAVNGSPLSGAYGGAKRMVWFLGQYANNASAELKLGIKFQVLVPRQMIGETRLGQAAAGAYAKKRGITLEEQLAGFGKPMPPRTFGEHVVTILSDPQYADGVAFSLKGDFGIAPLDGGAS